MSEAPQFGVKVISYINKDDSIHKRNATKVYVIGQMLTFNIIEKSAQKSLMNLSFKYKIFDYNRVEINIPNIKVVSIGNIFKEYTFYPEPTYLKMQYSVLYHSKNT